MEEYNNNIDLKSKKHLYKKGDSMLIMKKMPNNSVDLFLTDPPYKDYQSNRPIINKKTKKIYASKFNFEEFINEMERILKPSHHFYIFCDHLTFSNFFRAINDNNSLVYKNMIVWVKNNHGSGDLKGNYAPQHELVIYGYKKGPIRRQLLGKRTSNVLFKKNNDCIQFIKKISNYKYNHSTIKPLEILIPFIEKSSKPNELVFDPYAGSFSTSEAAIITGRRSFGIEIESSHITNAKRRIRNALKSKSHKSKSLKSHKSKFPKSHKSKSQILKKN